MTFVHPLYLLLLLLPVAWILLAWRAAPRRLLLALKAASIAAVIVALSEPVFHYDDPKLAVAVLADTSASLTSGDLDAETKTVRAIQSRGGSNFVQLLPFARTTRALAPAERARNGKLEYSKGDSGRGTNLEAAIRDGIAALPAGAVRRIALISDGNENLGSVTRAAWQAQQLGIAIDTFPLAGHARPSLRVESVSAPAEVFSGEHFPVALTVTSPSTVDAVVELEASGRSLGSKAVKLEPGENRFIMRAALNTTGAIALLGHIGARGAASPFEYAITVRRPRVLLLSQDPPEADAHLAQILTANQFDVERSSRDLPPELSPFQLIVYNNWDMERISETAQTRLESFEKEGGGLLWISGEKNVYVDRKNAPEEPLARALPAKLAPPRSPEGKAVILIIDKSSSMEGKKMDLAKQASIGVVDNLKPQDWIAVLIFDNSFQWAVPMRKAEDRSQIKRLISGITPDGGTQIAPALAEAYQKIKAVDAVYKHIVLLTDGISEEGDSVSMAREASLDRVTISTVGLGQDVNRSYLEKIAANAKGKSYFLLEPNGLEQILLKDVQEHTGTTAVERSLKAEVKDKADLLDGVDFAAAPPLEGYVRFDARPDADEILAMDRDPLLVRWQYGLGRSAVFTSDAKNRWASAWLEWKDFDRFWTNVFRDLLPHAPPSEAVAEYDPATEDLTVNYRLGQQVPEPEKIPDIFVLGPAEFRQPAQVTKIGAGAYRARVRIGGAQGLFRVRPLAESRAFPEVGFFRNEAELTDFGTNETLLRQLAASTGGRYQPQPAQVFDAGGRRVPSTLRLWPLLIGLAVVLNLIELVARKWKGIREWLPAKIVHAT